MELASELASNLELAFQLESLVGFSIWVGDWR